jgi:hypothetical protein
VVIKKRFRRTPPTLVCDTEVEDQEHRTHNFRQVAWKLNVSTPLTPVPQADHLVCLYFVGCVNQVNNLLNHPIMVLFKSRKSRVPKPKYRGSPHPVRVKKVFHTLSGQDSSLRLLQITPSHVMVLYHKIPLGAFSS